MSSPRRQCEMQIPDDLVEKLERLPGGIKPMLTTVEKEFGLHTYVSYMGAKNYVIVGPNPDILELAVETLQRRYFAQEENRENKSAVSGEIDSGRRAIWKFQGDYAVKASQLFMAEIEEINKVPSVHVHVSPLKLEFTSSFDDVETVKAMIDKLQEDINNLLEADIEIVGSHVELVKLRQFIQRKLQFDQTAVCILNEQKGKFTVFAKTEDSLKRIMDEWESIGKVGNKAQRMSSSSFSYSTISQHPHYKSEMKLPGGIVSKLEKQRGGINYILNSIEKEFGLKVDYIRHKHLKIFGPHLEVLELAAQTLVHRYVIKTPPQNGVIGQLQGKNAIWKFIGNYAKKVIHLFAKELKRLKRIRTVSVKATPCKLNPTCLEILCSVRVVERVKSQVEKMVGQVHNLFEKDIQISDDPKEIYRVKRLITITNDQGEVLCLFDDNSRILKIVSRNEMLVLQVITKLQEQRRKHPRDEMPGEFWTMYRQLYQTKISEEVVHKLEQAPGGIVPVIQRIEKEYGVKTMYNRKKQMILISPTEDVLELAQETLISRYAHDEDEPGTDNSSTKTVPIAETENEEKQTAEPEEENAPPEEEKGKPKEHSAPERLPEIDTTVHKLHNLHHGYTPPPSRSRGYGRSKTRSIIKSPSRSPDRNYKAKKVVFA